jgi:hypothetical protein
MLRSISLFLLLVSLSYASIVIYKDKAELSYLPTKKLVGFNANIKLKSSEGELRLVQGSCRELNTKVCRSLNEITELQAKNNSLQNQKRIIQMTLDESCFDTKDANKVVVFVQNLSDKIVSLEKTIAKNKLKIQQEKSKYVLPSQRPYLLVNLPKKMVTAEFRGLSFSSQYELDIDKSVLKHQLSFINNSGVNIKITKARVFDRYMSNLPCN